MLFLLQLSDWLGVASFCSQPTTHLLHCTEGVSVCSPSAARPACGAGRTGRWAAGRGQLLGFGGAAGWQGRWVISRCAARTEQPWQLVEEEGDGEILCPPTAAFHTSKSCRGAQPLPALEHPCCSWGVSSEQGRQACPSPARLWHSKQGDQHSWKPHHECSLPLPKCLTTDSKTSQATRTLRTLRTLHPAHCPGVIQAWETDFLHLQCSSSAVF